MNDIGELAPWLFGGFIRLFANLTKYLWRITIAV